MVNWSYQEWIMWLTKIALMGCWQLSLGADLLIEVSHVSIISRKANATSLLQSTGQDIDKQLDTVAELEPWVIRLFTVNPGNKRLFEGQVLWSVLQMIFTKN